MNYAKKLIECSEQCKVAENKTKKDIQALLIKMAPSVNKCVVKIKKSKKGKKGHLEMMDLEMDKCLSISKNSKDYKKLKQTRKSAGIRIKKCIRTKCKKELNNFTTNVVRKASKKSKKSKK